MDNLKARLVIELPGSVMYEEQACSENANKMYENNVLNFSSKRGKGKNTVVEKYTIHYQTRKCKPAHKVINISQASYDAMTESTYIPYWFKEGKKRWASMTRTQRAQTIAENLANSEGGKVLDFTIFAD